MKNKKKFWLNSYFIFFLQIYAPGSGSGIRIGNADPDPDPQTQMNADPTGSGSGSTTLVVSLSSVIRCGKVSVYYTTTFYFQAFVSKVSKTGKKVHKVSRTDFVHHIFSIILSQRCFFEKGLL